MNRHGYMIVKAETYLPFTSIHIALLNDAMSSAVLVIFTGLSYILVKEYILLMHQLAKF